MFALLNRHNAAVLPEPSCRKLVQVRVVAAAAVAAAAAAAAAARCITPTALCEDPSIPPGQATSVQEPDLIYFSPGATVSPLFSTHPEKGPCSRSRGVQHTLGSKMPRYLQNRLTIKKEKKEKKFLDCHTILTLTTTSFSNTLTWLSSNQHAL